MLLSRLLIVALASAALGYGQNTGTSISLTMPTTFCSVTGANGALVCTYATGQTINSVFGTDSSGNVGLIGLTAAMIPSALSSTTSVNGTTIPNAVTLASASGTLTAGGIAYGGGTSVISATGAGTAKQIVLSGAGSAPTMIDFPDVRVFDAATCNSATGTTKWNIPAAGATPACRGGTNNLAGTLQMTPSAGTGVSQFVYELPLDWDTATQPYVTIYFGSGTNTTGTVIWTVSTACSKRDGSVTDDPAFAANSAFGTLTMAAATRMWTASGQLTTATSGNNCIVGSSMLVKVAVTGTAAAAINIYQATITVPRLLALQAN